MHRLELLFGQVVGLPVGTTRPGVAVPVWELRDARPIAMPRSGAYRRRSGGHRDHRLSETLARHDRWLLVIDNLDCDAVELVERRLPSELPSRLLITSQRPLPGSRSELEPLPLEVATDSSPTHAPSGRRRAAHRGA
jgi:hypothetical protein